jgi:hypothetical protein
LPRGRNFSRISKEGTENLLCGCQIQQSSSFNGASKVFRNFHSRFFHSFHFIFTSHFISFQVFSCMYSISSAKYVTCLCRQFFCAVYGIKWLPESIKRTEQKLINNNLSHYFLFFSLQGSLLYNVPVKSSFFSWTRRIDEEKYNF